MNLPRCSFSEPEQDSSKNGDPINLTPYIWTALKYSGLTDDDLFTFGVSVDRSMSINLNRVLTGLIEQRAQLTKELDEAREVVRHANNSLCGSDAYFVLNGDLRYLSNAAEILKASANAAYQRAEQAEAALESANHRADANYRLLQHADAALARLQQEHEQAKAIIQRTAYI